jgi:hypothetical protein
MNNLCCVLNRNTRHGVTCRDCSKEWECWCAWVEDRTHRTSTVFTTCPKTGNRVGWDMSDMEEGVEYIQNVDMPS